MKHSFKYKSAFVVILVIYLTGCSTDFDLYAPYKDISVVYCIANYSDDTTWMKITKAYYGPDNIMENASNPDSSNYPYKLNISITGIIDGKEQDPVFFDTLTIHNKNMPDTVINSSGDTVIMNPFYAPDQLVYYAVGNLDDEADYLLRIIKKNDDTVTSTCELISNFSVTNPTNRIIFVNNYHDDIEWASARNGYRYIVTLRFNYDEYASGYNDTVSKYVDWYLGTINSKNNITGETLSLPYYGDVFYELLQAKLPEIANVERWADNIEIIINCASCVLATYVDINTVGSVVSEEFPIYSNINDGVGIFASRHTIHKYVSLSVATERSLISDYDLGFKYRIE